MEMFYLSEVTGAEKPQLAWTFTTPVPQLFVPPVNYELQEQERERRCWMMAEFLSWAGALQAKAD
jgi:hypothetical protein